MRQNGINRLAGIEVPRRTNRAVTASVLLLVALSTVSVLTLPFAARWYDVQSLDDAIRHPPSLSPVLSPTPFAQRPHAHGEGQRETTPPFVERFAYRFTSLLGHDDLGRSLLFRLLPAVLISAAIGLAAAAIAVVVGVSWGALSALAGGRIDLAMMRIVDVFYGLPYILMVILLKMGLTPPLTALFPDHDRAANVLVLFVAIGGVSWLTMARVVRGQVLSLKEAPFVEAARVSGASTLRILGVHIVPNLIGTVLTYALLVVPQAILQEAFLSFLGIGIQQPTPSLGRLAADGVEAVNMFVGYWWLLIFPCGVLVITLLALNIVGDALRDWYDPKSAALASP